MFSKELLKELGVIDWAYTETLKAISFKHFDNWVESGKHGELGYLADHRKDLRKSLTSVFPNCKSAVVFLFDYHGVRKEFNEIFKDENYNGLKVASYSVAFDGEDYHIELARRLDLLGSKLKDKYPSLNFKMSLDIHPVLERDLAYRSGLGFFGKNSMLISKEHGSFFLIGSLVLDQQLDEKTKEPENDHCGSCTACIDACPTAAIDVKSRTITANKCISTYTIELFKDTTQIPDGFVDNSKEVFGCDICQDVCPWNKRQERQGLINSVVLKGKSKELIDFYLLRPVEQIKGELEQWSNNYYKKHFKGTSFERTGRVGLLKNIKNRLGKKP
jgi:epoxyqueuosine reductase